MSRRQRRGNACGCSKVHPGRVTDLAVKGDGVEVEQRAALFERILKEVKGAETGAEILPSLRLLLLAERPRDRETEHNNDVSHCIADVPTYVPGLTEASHAAPAHKGAGTAPGKGVPRENRTGTGGEGRGANICLEFRCQASWLCIPGRPGGRKAEA